MKNLRNLLNLVAIGVFLVAMVGCSDHEHSNDGNGGHSHSEENKNPQPKHDTLK
ncbi:hypothetical protein [Aliarcobacter cryaerophilus]|mgnify:CR=1 FL=1|uniref:hypothetical protein n=1 Tax=Aliarcobacter cryaerophilus TaxID=28198 RepID=UPI003DA1DF14